MTTKTKQRAETETIEFRPHPAGNDTPYVSIEVPKALADACRVLDQRREHGTHLLKIGGVDILGEFSLFNVPVAVKAFDGRGTGRNEVWAIPRADFRFAG